jgi:photosystem II stability/assembly factor-like uncharacterized protein
MFKKTACLGVLLLSTLALWSGVTTPEKRLESFARHRQMVEESVFASLIGREIGPHFCGGRIVDIEAYPGRPHTLLIAAASGGLWRSDNNATTWTPLFDHESSITIGNFAVSQRNPQLLWVGSGESNSSRSSYAGTGVFKSLDGGRNWQNMGLADSHHISRVLIDPDQDEVVFVSVLGHLYSENEERGVFRTSDGGKTWQKVLTISPRTGVIDLIMEPGNSRVLYAAAWQRDRKAWHFTPSGPESGIYKSTDGGDSWQKLSGGFPQSEHVGRIGLAVSPQKPQVVYAFLDNQAPRPEEKASEDEGDDANQRLFQTRIRGGEVYRSDDGGTSWRRTHEGYLDGLVYTYGYYFGEIRVSPDNPDNIYVLGVPLLRSMDGGRTFQDISEQGGIYGVNGVHADMQALWIDPVHPDRLILGNDGGLNISYDRGATWQKINNLPLAQVYTVETDMARPYKVYTGLQDNGVNMGLSSHVFNDPDSPWRMILGGDGAYVAPHPEKEGLVFAAFQFGSIFRLDLGTGANKSIQPRSPDKQRPYRFNWLTPFMVSRHNPSILYLGAERLLMSYNEGENWLEISPDLTHQKNTGGNVPYATITAIDESPLSPEILYAGSDDGRVWGSRNRGGTWQERSAGLPGKWVTRITASRFQAGRVYLSMTGYREDDFSTYVYVSDDFGENWRAIRGNLPDEPVNVIREDVVREDLLYLGTDLGLFISLDRGVSWQALKANLPTVAVYDLKVQPRDPELVVGTHGRGIYILPLDKIRCLEPKHLEAPLTLFDIPAVRLGETRRQPQNPVQLSWFMAQAGDLDLSISDAQGKTVLTRSLKGNRGFNGFSWNLLDQRKKGVTAGAYTLRLRLGRVRAEGRISVE